MCLKKPMKFPKKSDVRTNSMNSRGNFNKNDSVIEQIFSLASLYMGCYS